MKSCLSKLILPVKFLFNFRLLANEINHRTCSFIVAQFNSVMDQIGAIRLIIFKPEHIEPVFAHLLQSGCVVLFYCLEPRLTVSLLILNVSFYFRGLNWLIAMWTFSDVFYAVTEV
jgi:hypothetical protein